MSSANTPKFSLDGIQDQRIRDNFRALSQYLRLNLNLVGFRHFEITFTDAVSNYSHPHGLGFQPKDILQTSLTGGGTVTYNYDNFDEETLDLTVSGACVVRFYVGTHLTGVIT